MPQPVFPDTRFVENESLGSAARIPEAFGTADMPSRDVPTKLP
jgi:hypothetical protein